MTARKQPKPRACPICGRKDPAVMRFPLRTLHRRVLIACADNTHEVEAYGPTREAAIALWNGKGKKR